MKYKIIVRCQGGNRWEADRPGHPSTVVGRGRTWKEALGDLFLHDTRIARCLYDIFVQDSKGKPYKFHKRDRR